MLHIERMKIRLPNGYEHRAAGIARLIGDSLAGYSADKNINLKSISIGPVKMEQNTSDQEIAEQIAEKIRLRLGEES